MTRTLQIIIAAMALGALSFGVGMIVVASNMPNVGNGNNGQAMPVLTYATAAVALVALFTAWVLPSMLAGVVQQRIADGQPVVPAYIAQHQAKSQELGDVMALAGAYQTLAIIRAATLEGTAFFCLIVYLIEKQTLSLVAAGVTMAALLSQFPTRSRVEDWVDGELAAIEQLRQMGTINVR